jgi:LPXTG-motif cell wall-anchored protein
VDGNQATMPADLEAGPNGTCVVPDDVLGEIIHRGNRGPEVLPSRLNQAAQLPLTGASHIGTYVLIALGMVLLGTALIVRRRRTQDERRLY